MDQLSNRRIAPGRSGVQCRLGFAVGLICVLALVALPPVSRADQPGPKLSTPALDEELDSGAAEKAASEKSAATFSCQVSTTGVEYCQYSGPVGQLYFNSGRFILLYPDSQVSATQIQNEVESSGYETYWGVDVTQFYAFGFQSPAKSMETSDPDQFYNLTDFGKKAYAMLMAAQMSGRSVTVQFRGADGAFLKIERMWLQ